MIDFSANTIKNDLSAYDNIRKVATGQFVDYATACLLDYPYFKEYHKLTAINLNKQQALDTDPKAIQQINFNGNMNRAEGATVFFIIYKVKETVLDFSKGKVKVL